MTNSKILVLVDGSAYSESVCRHSAWIAGKLNAAVNILHVLGRRDGGTPQDLSGTIGLGARTALLKELAELDAGRSRLAHMKGQAILEDAEAILRERGVEEVSGRLQRGDLIEAAIEADADAIAIVIGKRGEGADFASGHLGSNLERLVRSVMAPVFITSRQFRPIHRVMIAFDGSQSNKRALKRMADSMVFRNLDIHLVHAGHPTPEMAASIEESAAVLTSAGLNTTSEMLPGDPEETLPSKIERSQFDLLVMGAYAHSRVRNLIIGSTTTAMIQSCKIPVLIYR